MSDAPRQSDAPRSSEASRQESPFAVLGKLLERALAAPNAARDPTAGRVIGGLIVALATSRGRGDRLVEGAFTPHALGTVDFEVRCYAPGEVEPSVKVRRVDGAAAVRTAMALSVSEGGAIEVIVKERGRKPRCVLSRSGDGAPIFVFPSIERAPGAHRPVPAPVPTLIRLPKAGSPDLDAGVAVATPAAEASGNRVARALDTLSARVAAALERLPTAAAVAESDRVALAAAVAVDRLSERVVAALDQLPERAGAAETAGVAAALEQMSERVVAALQRLPTVTQAAEPDRAALMAAVEQLSERVGAALQRLPEPIDPSQFDRVLAAVDQLGRRVGSALQGLAAAADPAAVDARFERLGSQMGAVLEQLPAPGVPAEQVVAAVDELGNKVTTALERMPAAVERAATDRAALAAAVEQLSVRVGAALQRLPGEDTTDSGRLADAVDHLADRIATAFQSLPGVDDVTVAVREAIAELAPTLGTGGAAEGPESEAPSAEVIAERVMARLVGPGPQSLGTELAKALAQVVPSADQVAAAVARHQALAEHLDPQAGDADRAGAEGQLVDIRHELDHLLNSQVAVEERLGQRLDRLARILADVAKQGSQKQANGLGGELRRAVDLLNAQVLGTAEPLDGEVDPLAYAPPPARPPR